jgi:DNA invertase Pin-like site-specific DNA recombinase
MAAKGLESKYDMNSLVNQIMLMVLSAVAEMEFENTKKKFAEGKIAWAQRGYSIGGSAPFGFCFKEERLPQGNRMKTRKKLVEIPEEQAVLRTIEKCRQRGLGARRIAKQVANTHAGFENFTPTKVQKIIARKFQGVAS